MCRAVACLSAVARSYQRWQVVGLLCLSISWDLIYNEQPEPQLPTNQTTARALVACAYDKGQDKYRLKQQHSRLGVPWFTLRLFLVGVLWLPVAALFELLSRFLALPSSPLAGSSLTLLPMAAAFRSVMLSYAPIGSRGYAVGVRFADHLRLAAAAVVFLLSRSTAQPNATRSIRTARWS